MTATKRTWTQRIVLTAFLLTMTVMAGCLRGEAIRTGNYYPPKPANAIVNVYMDTAPTLPYEEVGIVSATGTEWNAELIDVLSATKDKAVEVQEKLDAARATERKIAAAREEYSKEP